MNPGESAQATGARPHVATSADARSATTGDRGLAFLNFRRDASMQEYGKVKETEPETAIARGGRFVGDLR